MNIDNHVLFVSASMADETVLAALLARAGLADAVRLSTASDSQLFFEALYSEEIFDVVVIDDRPLWSPWQKVASICRRHRPNAVAWMRPQPLSHPGAGEYLLRIVRSREWALR